MTGQTVAYRRVSSTDQKLDRQLDGLTFDREFEEKLSGATTDRPALQDMIAYVREGDAVVVHSIDRLARNLVDLQNIIEQVNAKGASIKFHKEQLIFSGEDNPMAQLQLQIIGAVAQFERSMIKQRQAEGIAKAKAKGVYKGGQKQINRENIKILFDEGKSAIQIAREVGCSRAQVYNIKSELGL